MSFFTVTWRIENFSMCTQRVGEALTCPKFSIPLVNNVKWDILLYPKGDDQVRDGDHLSCHIRTTHQEPCSDVKKFLVVFVFVNLDPVLSYSKIADAMEIGENKTNSFSSLILHNKLLAKGFLPRDTLTIRFHIWPRFDGISPPAYPDIEGAFLSYSYSPHFTSEECFSNFNESGETSLTQCSFLTRIPVERRILYWRIREVRAKRRSKEKTSVKFESGLNGGVKLLLVGYVKGSKGNESFRIDVLRKGANLGRNFIKCEATVFDSHDIAISVQKIEHYFGKAYTRWSFPMIKNVNSSKYIGNDDAIKMKFEFHISYDSLERSSTGSDDAQKDVLKMLEYEETFDASFECKNGKKFPVHKFLLCAKSPVFRAMFSSDTLEKQTGVVRMLDTDTATVQHLRDYLYSKSLPDVFVAEDILQLYSVADKYNIEALKDKCAAFLRNNDLSVDNVCDILTVADMHQDTELLSYASDFLMAEMDLCSDTWRRFVEKNAKLAAETLKNCLLKVKREI